MDTQVGSYDTFDILKYAPSLIPAFVCSIAESSWNDSTPSILTPCASITKRIGPRTLPNPSISH